LQGEYIFTYFGELNPTAATSPPSPFLQGELYPSATTLLHSLPLKDSSIIQELRVLHPVPYEIFILQELYLLPSLSIKVSSIFQELSLPSLSR
jgi:hypothetical protein